MGFKAFYRAMTVKDGARAPAFATAVPAMFEALQDIFAPLDVTYRIDDESWVHIARLDATRSFNTTPLWCDEELTRDALTRCTPTLGTDVIAELCDRLAGRTPAWFYISAEGALRHRAAGDTEPAWYGRWRHEVLDELVTVSFTWTKDPLRGFEMRCPLSGYPFTAVQPMVRGNLVDGDAATAAHNRAALIPSLCRVREALGFDRAEIDWHNDGDYGALYPIDRADLWKTWLPKLATS